jgi:hypothetical protein
MHRRSTLQAGLAGRLGLLRIRSTRSDQAIAPIDEARAPVIPLEVVPLHAGGDIEIWFSILHRRLLRYGDFGSVEHQRDEVEAFIVHWNKREAHPFRWTWRADQAQNPQRQTAPAAAA